MNRRDAEEENGEGDGAADGGRLLHTSSRADHDERYERQIAQERPGGQRATKQFKQTTEEELITSKTKHHIKN